MKDLGMLPDEFITTCADTQEQRDFYNSLDENQKEHINTFMLAYRGYGNFMLLQSLKESIKRDSTSLDDELRKLMNEK